MIKQSIKIEGNGINVSSNIDTFDPSTNNYLISDSNLSKFKILAGETLSKNILENIDFSLCTFIYVCLSDVDLVSTVNDARFTLSIDANIIGDFSQFTFTNGSLLAQEITIDTIASTKDTYLTIIIGTK